MNNESAKSPPAVIFRRGKRVNLSVVQRAYLPAMQQQINDPEITLGLAISFPMTLDREEEYLKKINRPEDGDIILALTLAHTDEYIGVMGLHNVSFQHGTAATGSIIGRKDLWGKGYGTEAKMLLLDYAFNTLNLRKIGSVVYDYNLGSKRCLEKCGYKVEGIKKAQHFRCGRYIDDIMMAVFREEWLPLWQEYKKNFLDQK